MFIFHSTHSPNVFLLLYCICIELQEKLEKSVEICYTIYNLIKPSSSVSSQRSGLFLCSMCIFFIH
nr:MAG TPA: hypothetical protein [Caudoviricetes sp.]